MTNALSLSRIRLQTSFIFGNVLFFIAFNRFSVIRILSNISFIRPGGSFHTYLFWFIEAVVTGAGVRVDGGIQDDGGGNCDDELNDGGTIEDDEDEDEDEEEKEDVVRVEDNGGCGACSSNEMMVGNRSSCGW